MQTHNLGYPRIGGNRELKKACEGYWSGKISLHELQSAGESVRRNNWEVQKEAGIDLIPSNDFSFYDQVLDLSMTVGAIPERYHEVILKKGNNELDLYFAMARGYQKDGLDITAMEMTKWFDTNYHYIVPEFKKDQQFKLFSTKVIQEYIEAKNQGLITKPVLIGPVSFLLLGKEKETGFDRIDLIKNILPVYLEVLKKLEDNHVEWVQFDEPFLAMDLNDKEKDALVYTYGEIRKAFPDLKILLANYFDCFGANLKTALSLPVDTFHLDLVRCPSQLDDILESGLLKKRKSLSLGLVDGRNIWKNDYLKSQKLIEKAINAIGSDRIFIAPSCSLLHAPIDLELEDEKGLSAEVKDWLAFAKQKLQEVKELGTLTEEKLAKNQASIQSRNKSKLIHKNEVKERIAGLPESIDQRKSPFSIRQQKQKMALNLPLFPTTTIGSFPQTTEVRSWRAKFKKGVLSKSQYNKNLESETIKAIQWQEAIGLDVLVHGEFERNDMVEYFGEQLDGFLFTKNGWVQSYGSRCVKPPIIYGDVSRPSKMTVDWTSFAQSQTEKLVKGMLTGPVTILQWSFVRDDQPRKDTCNQIALAIRDEVIDLEKAGIKIIQIDEPAIREGLPLRKSDWQSYLDWAVKAFRISASGVQDETQIHTHMCYSEFNDIIENIAAMDADVITIECSRSQMELLDAFGEFNYPNEIGPGVYDIHSPRVPARNEMYALLEKAVQVIPESQLWVNPDCGLKTRGWEETKSALIEMVSAAKLLRESISEPIG
ncbi:5-methyltetrahydropteroyltriglutamate--homocysteine S-methyltransferase [Algoriphagus machipongonensis]|uniref:5-methyltetrahydropteroyltriglutamate--homocysteine methyltransferase n=1 Tax=Algoriphagus machipongonensis TaxID=388413 RepID=A3HU67_9BACT|nr:5-methyltetrahydropteroyltriglutamate--homocysteine S-methyltransferase [Algoriphagus machipongonensis]EAZ81689.1 5-methyltetrahydropteroyltriglutamate--homocysteine S-methyltransferase [Algoriphagus machipongonensis]